MVQAISAAPSAVFCWKKVTASPSLTPSATAAAPLSPSGATFVEGDLSDRTLLEQTLTAGSFDGILHFAALIEAGESMKHPEVYFRNNTAGTLTLLEAMQATGHNRIVFSSTAACYGEPESTPILEDAKLAPTNTYGESKLLSEHMMRWMNQVHGLRYAALRYFNVAGAIPGYGENHEPESHLIPLLLDVALGLRPNIKDLRPRTTQPRMAPASATTSTSATSQTPISSPSRPSPSTPASSTTSATARASPSSRSSTPSAASPAAPSPLSSIPAAPETPPS